MELWDNDQIILFIMFDFIKVLKPKMNDTNNLMIVIWKNTKRRGKSS